MNRVTSSFSTSNVNFSPTPGSSSIACSVSPRSRAPSTERATNGNWDDQRGNCSAAPRALRNRPSCFGVWTRPQRIFGVLDQFEPLLT